MKKSNYILIIVAIVLSMFTGIKNVKAATTDSTMFIECTYKFTYGIVEGKKIEKNNPPLLYVAYTDIKDGSGAYFNIQTRYSTGGSLGDYESIGKMTGYFGYDVESFAASYTSFQQRMNDNGGTCPNYMYIEYYEDDEYIPYFSNDMDKIGACSLDSSTGQRGSKCKSYFTLDKVVENIKFNPSEDIWNAYYSYSEDEEDVCSDLNIDISIKNNQLYVLPTYGNYTRYLDGKNWGSFNKIIDISFDEIMKFALNNKVDNFTFDPDITGTSEYVDEDIFYHFQQTTGFAFTNSSSYWWDYTGALDVCSKSNAVFTRGKNCTEFSSIAAMVNLKLTNFKNDFETAQEEAVNIKAIRQFSQGYFPHTYANITDVNELNTIYENITSFLENAITKEEFKTQIEEYQEELTTLFEGVCTSENSSKEYYINSGNNLSLDYGSLFTKIGEALENLSTRSAELDNEELAQKATETQAKVEEMASEMKEYFLVLQEKYNVIDDTNLNLTGLGKRGCAILSTDLTDFLKTILWYVRIAGVVLAIILSLLDYIKAAAGSDEKSMSAANKRFVTRMLLVAVLFLIPVLLEFVLGALNISTTAGSLECLK